jgi:hypothetical protein
MPAVLPAVGFDEGDAEGDELSEGDSLGDGVLVSLLRGISGPPAWSLPRVAISTIRTTRSTAAIPPRLAIAMWSRSWRAQASVR